MEHLSSNSAIPSMTGSGMGQLSPRSALDKSHLSPSLALQSLYPPDSDPHPV